MESNFYTTPRHIVVRERFLHLARASYREMARGKRWTVMPLCRRPGGIYLVLREWKVLGEETEAG
jgi:hypothetical protein